MRVKLSKLGLEVAGKPAFGQILPGSAFGEHLTGLAMEAETIVEIGTWRGLGSTYCLALGLERDTQRLLTIDVSREKRDEAASYYDDPRIEFLWGTVVKPFEATLLRHPDEEFAKYCNYEIHLSSFAPYVLDRIPEQIDLLFLDGGSWSGPVEFTKLYPRARVIALDDTNPERDCKHHESREILIWKGWRPVYDALTDRNGCAIFRRP